MTKVLFGFLLAVCALALTPKAEAQIASGNAYLRFDWQGATYTNIHRLHINYYCPNPYLHVTHASPIYVGCADQNEYGEWERVRCYNGDMHQQIRIEGRGNPNFVDLQAFTDEPVWSRRYSQEKVQVYWELYCR